MHMDASLSPHISLQTEGSARKEPRGALYCRETDVNFSTHRSVAMHTCNFGEHPELLSSEFCAMVRADHPRHSRGTVTAASPTSVISAAFIFYICILRVPTNVGKVLTRGERICTGHLGRALSGGAELRGGTRSP